MLAGIELPEGLAKQAGIGEVRALLQAAMRLRRGEYHPQGHQPAPLLLATQAPTAGTTDDAYGGGRGWGPSERVQLLQLVVELAIEGGTLRAHIDGAEGRRKEARKQVRHRRGAGYEDGGESRLYLQGLSHARRHSNGRGSHSLPLLLLLRLAWRACHPSADPHLCVFASRCAHCR